MLLNPQLHCGRLDGWMKERDSIPSSTAWEDRIVSCILPGVWEDMNKPRRGLWTSTYDATDAYESDWLRFIDQEHGPHESVMHGKGYILEVERDANLLVIDTEYDWDKALADYELIDYDMIDEVYLFDWNRIARDYDGVHATRHGYQYMEKFDCESTVWFRPRFASVEEVYIEKRGW